MCTIYRVLRTAYYVLRTAYHEAAHHELDGEDAARLHAARRRLQPNRRLLLLGLAKDGGDDRARSRAGGGLEPLHVGRTWLGVGSGSGSGFGFWDRVRARVRVWVWVWAWAWVQGSVDSFG